MDQAFTLKNSTVRRWLVAVLSIGVILVVLRPPCFWLSGIGAGLVVLASASNSARTWQWMSWQNEGSLNWFEGCAASTGALLAALPLGAAILRSWVTA